MSQKYRYQPNIGIEAREIFAELDRETPREIAESWVICSESMHGAVDSALFYQIYTGMQSRERRNEILDYFRQLSSPEGRIELRRIAR